LVGKTYAEPAVEHPKSVRLQGREAKKQIAGLAGLRRSQSPKNARKLTADKVDEITGLKFAISSQAKHDDERRPRVLGQAVDGGQAEADSIPARSSVDFN
jgi:hypothetical protein